MASRGPDPVEKSLSRLGGGLAEGAHYETQQRFKTLYARYRNKGQYQEAYRLAEGMGRLQLAKGSLTCGIECAMLLVEAYVADETPATQEDLDRVLSLYSAFPERPNPVIHSISVGVSDSADTEEHQKWPVKECVNFMTTAVKWLGRCGSKEQIQHIHGKTADYIWRCCGSEGFAWATAHFVRADNKQSFAVALLNCVNEAPSSEEDLFIVRACLQTLAVAQPATAERQLEGCFELVNEIGMFKAGTPLPDTPLMHFLTFLLQALRKQSVPLEQMLRSRYESVLSRDPLLGTLLSTVEQVYLGLKAPGPGGMADMMSSLMQGLMG